MKHRAVMTITALILCAALLASECSARTRKRNQIRKDPMRLSQNVFL